MVPPIPFFKLIGYLLYIIVYMYATEAYMRYPDESIKSAFFKVLPMLQLLFVVMSTDQDDRHNRELKGFHDYRKWIVLGLLFSIGGDICLVWRVKLFIPGLLFFAIAQALYVRGFGFTPFGSAPTLVSCLLIAGTTFLFINSGIKDGPVMQGLVLLYCILIFTMGWRALVQCQWNTTFCTVFALIGAVSFIVSDFIIAYDKWVGKIDNSSVKVMATYWTAQLFIALSASGYVSRPKSE